MNSPRRFLHTVPVTRVCVECHGSRTLPASVAAGFPSGRRPCNCTGHGGRPTWIENVTLIQLATEMENAKADLIAYQQSIIDEKQASDDAIEVAAEVAAALAKRIEARKTATIEFLK